MCPSGLAGWVLLGLLSISLTSSKELSTTDNLFTRRIVVTNQAMGARCAVAADFDGDGRLDLVSASSNDNAVSWFRNQGVDADTGALSFAIKQKITWSSLGSRIVATGDIDNDGDVDVVGASYYDNTVRWFENDGAGQFTPRVVSTTVNEGQGVTVADLDNDGDLDIVTASSGDNTIAVFKNLDRGVFCEIKDIVDDNAIGARTVIATDLDGDGMLDLASASKDDDTVAWYPNDGTGHFPTKLIISAGTESAGAYSLVAADIDQDGDTDLIVASNGNDHVSLWRNDGAGAFTKTLIFGSADFVLSVTAIDFDRDGDLDVASASFFDGYIRWYENLDGRGTLWQNHTLYVGTQGHYVANADVDGDGDADLIGVMHAENSVLVFRASTSCDGPPAAACCAEGTSWDGAACVVCAAGTYGVGSGAGARCVTCPTDTCVIRGLSSVPSTCSGITGCADPAASIRLCACAVNTVRDAASGVCEVCSSGQARPSDVERALNTLGNYTKWEAEQGVCEVVVERDSRKVMYGVIGGSVVIAAIVGLLVHRQRLAAQADSLWTIRDSEITYDLPAGILGTGTFGVVMQGSYRGTAVAVKRVFPCQPPASTSTKNMLPCRGTALAAGSRDCNPRSNLNVTAAGSLECSSWNKRDSADSASALGLPLATLDPRLSVSAPAHIPTSPKSRGSFPALAADAHWRPSFGSAEGAGTNGGSQGLEAGSVADSASFSQASGRLVASGRLSEGFRLSNAVRKQLRKDFIAEMRLLAKLRHPCITTIMGAVLSEEPLLVMECMGNGSLRDLLSNPSFPLDPEVTLPMLRDILQGTRFLHAASPPILHGDLKAANILVDDNWRAKVSDFGLSAKRKSGFVGTPFWMAPELLSGGFITRESDVYSFGVTLWELMTRQIPYADVELPGEQILELVGKGELRPDCGNELDAELVECFQECWAQDPGKRPTLEDLEMKLIPLCGQNFYTAMERRHMFANKQARLLQDVFPEHIAAALLAGKKVEPEDHACVTIYFSDIVGFTTISSKLSAQEVSQMLDRLYTAFDDLAGNHAVFKLETIGDAWVGVSNLAGDQPDHAARIARFSIDALHAARATLIHPDKPEMGCVQIRVGFHSGPVVSNVVGTRNPRYCLFGDTMNTASRMEANSEALRIHCSAAAAKLVQRHDPSLALIPRGRIPIKGKGKMTTFWVHSSADAPAGGMLSRIESGGSADSEAQHEVGSIPERRPTAASLIQSASASERRPTASASSNARAVSATSVAPSADRKSVV